METQVSTKILFDHLMPNQVVKITSAWQLLKLWPDVKCIDTMRHFFTVDPNHSEYVKVLFIKEPVYHPVMMFCHPEGNEIIKFEDIVFPE